MARKNGPVFLLTLFSIINCNRLAIYVVIDNYLCWLNCDTQVKGGYVTPGASLL